MFQPSPDYVSTAPLATIGNTPLAIADTFCYLQRTLSLDDEITARLALANSLPLARSESGCGMIVVFALTLKLQYTVPLYHTYLTSIQLWDMDTIDSTSRNWTTSTCTVCDSKVSTSNGRTKCQMPPCWSDVVFTTILFCNQFCWSSHVSRVSGARIPKQLLWSQLAYRMPNDMLEAGVRDTKISCVLLQSLWHWSHKMGTFGRRQVHMECEGWSVRAVRSINLLFTLHYIIYIRAQYETLRTDIAKSCKQLRSSNLGMLHESVMHWLWYLLACLMMFCVVCSEVLDEHNPWYCPRCRKNQCASKTMSVWRYPDTLVVQLKRYISSSCVIFLSRRLTSYGPPSNTILSTSFNFTIVF